MVLDGFNLFGDGYIAEYKIAGDNTGNGKKVESLRIWEAFWLSQY